MCRHLNRSWFNSCAPAAIITCINMKISTDITKEQITKFFVSDPNLSYIGLSDEDLVHLFKNASLVFNDATHCVGLLDNKNNLIGVLKYEFFSSCTVSAHAYLSTANQNKKLTKELKTCVIDYFKSMNGLKKIICMVPATCGNVHRAMTSMGLVHEGTITKSCMWRQELVDLLIYGINI